MSPSSQRLVLGIDPGLNTTGYAIIARHGESIGGTFEIVEAGVVRSRAKDSLPERLAEIHQGIAEVLETHTVDLVALEQLFSHYERPRTAILMGHARGVICLAAATHGVTVEHFEPTRVKKTITGNGRAPKSQIGQAVKWQLGLDEIPQPADVADAMAIALCGHASDGQDLG